MRGRKAKAGKYFFQYVKGDYRPAMQAIWDDDNKTVTTYLPRIHELFTDAWRKIYDMHKGCPPDYDKFREQYQQYYPSVEGAPKASLHKKTTIVQSIKIILIFHVL